VTLANGMICGIRSAMIFSTSAKTFKISGSTLLVSALKDSLRASMLLTMPRCPGSSAAHACRFSFADAADRNALILVMLGSAAGRREGGEPGGGGEARSRDRGTTGPPRGGGRGGAPQPKRRENHPPGRPPRLAPPPPRTAPPPPPPRQCRHRRRTAGRGCLYS